MGVCASLAACLCFLVCLCSLCFEANMMMMMRVANGTETAELAKIFTQSKLCAFCEFCARSRPSIACLNSRQVVSETVIYASGDSDVISFRIYASWFSPPSCGLNS